MAAISCTTQGPRSHLCPIHAIQMSEVVANCEVLIICCELNDQTRHMISKEVFLALRKRGLINDVGRGAVIDEGEMVRCLIDARRDRR